MNLKAQDYLAKLLAKENLTVQHGNYKTASFDVINRVLRLPLWADKGKAVYDLLVGHEVGHALYTPADGWHDSDKTIPGVPRSYINIVEDIRIEKKIQVTYPGIVRSFKKGYKTLFDDNLFGTEGKDISKYGLMDRLNIFAKGRGCIDIEFSADEQPLVDQAMAVETWEDVLESCQALNEFVKAKPEEEKENEDETESLQSPEGEGETEEEGEESGMSQDGSGDDEDDSEGTEGQSRSVEDDDSDTLTDDAQRDNEGSLLDKNERGIQDRYCAGIHSEDIKLMVTKFEELFKQRNDEFHSIRYNGTGAEKFYKDIADKIKPVVGQMAREFERKKAAWEYARSAEAKTGSLNVNKLHQYKYSEDIFLSVQQLAQAKSHGIVMFVDLSGSMGNILEDVIRQTLTIAQFCDRVNIPFEVYTFTSGANGVQKDEYKLGPSTLAGAVRTKIVEVLSSRMNKKQFKDACRHLSTVGVASWKLAEDPSVRMQWDCELDQMGSTPLLQTMIASADIITSFQKRNGVQKTNVIVLTDGWADSIHINSDDNISVDTGREWDETYSINFKGKMIKGKDTQTLLAGVVKAVGKYTNSNMLGFYLADDKGSFYQGLRYARSADKKGLYSSVESEKQRKDFLKNGVTAMSNKAGYDEFFIIKIATRRELENRTESFEPKKTEAIKDIKREFRKFSKGNKHTRQLVNKITDAVAA